MLCTVFFKANPTTVLRLCCRLGCDNIHKNIRHQILKQFRNIYNFDLNRNDESAISYLMLIQSIRATKRSPLNLNPRRGQFSDPNQFDSHGALFSPQASCEPFFRGEGPSRDR